MSNPADTKTPQPQGDFGYWFSDEQLAIFGSLTPLERLEWAEAARLFALMCQTPEEREHSLRLQRSGIV